MHQPINSFDNLKIQDYEYDYFYEDISEPFVSNAYDTFYPYYMENINFMDITKSCVIPTLFDVCWTYLPVLFICLAFQFINIFKRINIILRHAVCGILGIGVLYSHFENLILHFIILMVVSYMLVYVLVTYKIRTVVISILLLSYLILCEFIHEESWWARIRNIQMLNVMKIISLLSDLECKRISKLPSFIQYFGYMFCVGNCIFGPWVDYSSYLYIFRRKKLTAHLIFRIFVCLLKSLLFFTLSMCYVDWMWPESNQSNSFVMYSKAMEFRTSHYFIMFMSESFALAIGFSPFSKYADLDCVTKPVRIEFPRSLIEVVVFWNIPMHNWLKTYVFKPLNKYGSIVAIVGTYFVSSLLHGLNYQLSAILLSLAVYTYIEYVLRKKLSYKFDACILSKPCRKNCRKHQYTHRHLLVSFVNLFFVILTLYHLSYLGFLIDMRTDRRLNFNESFYSWKNERFSSHFVALITFIISLIL